MEGPRIEMTEAPQLCYPIRDARSFSICQSTAIQPSLVLVRNWTTFLWLVVVVGVFGGLIIVGVNRRLVDVVVVVVVVVEAVPLPRGLLLIATPPSALLLSLSLGGGLCHDDRRW